MSIYCSPSDVASLNRARVIGQGNNPNLVDVQTYIDMVGGEIDAILVNKGYDVPVNTGSWPEAGSLLRIVNAKGAWAMMEDASPNSPNLDRAKAAYDAALKMLSDAKFSFDADLEETRSEPRGPFVTYQPSGRTFDPVSRYHSEADDCDGAYGQSSPLPFFSRSMRF